MTMSTKVCHAQRESSSSRPCRSRHAAGKDGLCSLRAGLGRGEPAFRAVCSLREARGEEGRRNRLRPPPSALRHQRPPAVHRVARGRPLGRLPLPHVATKISPPLMWTVPLSGSSLNSPPMTSSSTRDGSTPRTRFSLSDGVCPGLDRLVLAVDGHLNELGRRGEKSTPCLRRSASAWGEIDSGSPCRKLSKTAKTSRRSRPARCSS